MKKKNQKEAKEQLKQHDQDDVFEDEIPYYNDIMVLENQNGVNPADLIKLKEEGYTTIQMFDMTGFRILEQNPQLKAITRTKIPKNKISH